MTSNQQCLFNEIMTLGKEQIDKSVVYVSLEKIIEILRIDNFTSEVVFDKLRELQRIIVEVENFDAEGRRKEIRFFPLITEFRIPNDTTSEKLISIELPLTLQERLTVLDANSVLSGTC